jgi:hypothetical protein
MRPSLQFSCSDGIGRKPGFVHAPVGLPSFRGFLSTPLLYIYKSRRSSLTRRFFIYIFQVWLLVDGHRVIRTLVRQESSRFCSQSRSALNISAQPTDWGCPYRNGCENALRRSPNANPCGTTERGGIEPGRHKPIPRGVYKTLASPRCGPLSGFSVKRPKKRQSNWRLQRTVRPPRH